MPDHHEEVDMISEKNTMYFSVSIQKLIVMSIVTSGLYELYMQYKNWELIKARENIDIMPFWRAFFAFFFCYQLFNRIRDTADSNQIAGSIAAGPLAIVWIVVTLMWRLPDPFWLVTYLAVLFLIPVQNLANKINEKLSSGHDKNRRYSGLNIATIVIGGIFFLLIVWGSFLPPEEMNY